MKLTDSKELKINEPTDTISSVNGLKDGYSLCGNRIIFLIDNETGEKIYLNTSNIMTY